jgi:hypothetical protein
MAESTSPRKMHEQAVQQIEKDYLAALSSAKTDREAAKKQAADAEKQAVLQAREAIKQGKARLRDGKDEIERSIREHDLREIVTVQEKTVKSATLARVKAISQANEAEKKAILSARENRKEALKQAELALKQANKMPKMSVPPNKEAINIRLDKVQDSDSRRSEVTEMAKIKQSSNTESVTSQIVTGVNSAKGLAPDTTSHVKVTLSFSGGINAEQLNSVENSLRQWPDIKLLMISGASSDIQMVVSAPASLLLSDRLKSLSVVENTVPTKGHIQIKLKSPSSKY